MEVAKAPALLWRKEVEPTRRRTTTTEEEEKLLLQKNSAGDFEACTREQG
jgi:hypothetical protein